MGYRRRKATTAKSKYSDSEFIELKKSFLADVHATVAMEDISGKLILNWDQTGINIAPLSKWTMEKSGISGLYKCAITAVFCYSIMGDFLPLQLIYKGKTECCHLLSWMAYNALAQ